jgi:hypothetical protein
VTIDEAMKVCGMFAPGMLSHGMGEWNGAGVVHRLNSAFPDFDWRGYMDHSGERTYWAITVRNYEPGEHYVARGKCVLCGKPASDLPLNEDRTAEYEAGR